MARHRLKLVGIFLFSWSLLHLSQTAVRARSVGDREASELGVIAQLVQTYIDKTGRLPSNWSDIWDADAVLGAKYHNPDRTPLYDRYSFVADNPPMVSPYDGSVVDGTILIMHNDPIDLATKPSITWKKGEEWWFVWVTSKHRARYAFVDKDRLSVGVGPGKIELKKPDIPQEKLDVVEKKLLDVGYLPSSVNPNLAPNPSSPQPAIQSSQPSPTAPSAPVPQLHVQRANDTGIPLWLNGVVVLSIAVIIGAGYYLSKRSSKGP